MKQTNSLRWLRSHVSWNLLVGFASKHLAPFYANKQGKLAGRVRNAFSRSTRRWNKNVKLTFFLICVGSAHIIILKRSPAVDKNDSQTKRKFCKVLFQIDGDLVRFDDVEPRHAGNYSCSARKRPDISQVIQLFVDFPPDVQVMILARTSQPYSVLCSWISFSPELLYKNCFNSGPSR